MDRNTGFFQAKVSNPNTLSAFISFQIITVRTYDDHVGGTYVDAVQDTAQFLEEEEDGEAIGPPFYSVYGLYGMDVQTQPMRWIGDFDTKHDAMVFVEDLTGLKMETLSR